MQGQFLVIEKEYSNRAILTIPFTNYPELQEGNWVWIKLRRTLVNVRCRVWRKEILPPNQEFLPENTPGIRLWMMPEPVKSLGLDNLACIRDELNGQSSMFYHQIQDGRGG